MSTDIKAHNLLPYYEKVKTDLCDELAAQDRDLRDPDFCMEAEDRLKIKVLDELAAQDEALRLQEEEMADQDPEV